MSAHNELDVVTDHPERVLHQAWAELVQEKGLATDPRRDPSPAQRRALIELTRAPERGYYARELAELADIDPDNLARQFRRWTRYGLVERERETGDPRALSRPLRVYYRLTEEGHRIAALAREVEKYGQD